DHGGHAMPVLRFAGELLCARAREGIKARAAIIFRNAPFRANPAALFEADERGIEGALIELEHIVRHLLEAAGDAEAVERAKGAERLKNEEIERPLENVGFGAGDHSIALSAFGDAYEMKPP